MRAYEAIRDIAIARLSTSVIRPDIRFGTGCGCPWGEYIVADDPQRSRRITTPYKRLLPQFPFGSMASFGETVMLGSTATQRLLGDPPDMPDRVFCRLRRIMRRQLAPLERVRQLCCEYWAGDGDFLVWEFNREETRKSSAASPFRSVSKAKGKDGLVPFCGPGAASRAA